MKIYIRYILLLERPIIIACQVYLFIPTSRNFCGYNALGKRNVIFKKLLFNYAERFMKQLKRYASNILKKGQAMTEFLLQD